MPKRKSEPRDLEPGEKPSSPIDETSRPTADKIIEDIEGIQREPQYRVTSM
jgi:hypothetical protein